MSAYVRMLARSLGVKTGSTKATAGDKNEIRNKIAKRMLFIARLSFS